MGNLAITSMNYWFVESTDFEGIDQTKRLVVQGIWEHNYPDEYEQ